MKKAFALALIPIVLSTVTTACSHAPTPQDILNQYLSAWQKQDYKTMYSLLSKDAKSKISKTAFVQRYQEISQGISEENLKTKVSSANAQAKASNNKITLNFKATWDTALTNPFTEKYQAHLVKDDDGWKVDWKSNLIFPQLKSGWKVHAQSQPSTRGEILTADGQYLAENQPAQQIGLVPGKMKSSSSSDLAKILGISESSVKTALNQSWVQANLFVPIQTLSQAKEQPLEAKLLAIPGVEIVPAQNDVRVYPQGDVGAHLVGYVAPITAQELTNKRKQEGYSASDVIGQQGLESAMESKLRGQIGGKIWVSDAKGDSSETLAQREAASGDTVTTTIDGNVEKALAEALGKNVGSAVVLNPSTGAVLGMVSQPGFDPNELVAGLSTSQWNKLNKAKFSPLVNRAVSAVPPGSALKPLVAGVALQDGVIHPSTTFPGTNHLKWQKDSSWGNFYVTRVPHPSGTVDLAHALIWSDNIYFAQVGLTLGQEKFIDGLSQFGFGKSLKFTLPVAKAQLSDNGKISTDIQLANSAYGQGQVLVSPLQLASMYTAFENKGDVLQPYLVKSVKTPSGSVVQSGKRTVLAAHVLNAKTLSILNADLRKIVTDPTGTAHGIDGVSGWTVSGKTGTAQTTTNGGEWGWFAAYAQKQGSPDTRYLIVMALANTQNKGESHYTVSQVEKFLELMH